MTIYPFKNSINNLYQRSFSRNASNNPDLTAKLPNEILVEICSYITDIKDNLSLNQVNHKFHEITSANFSKVQSETLKNISKYVTERDSYDQKTLMINIQEYLINPNIKNLKTKALSIMNHLEEITKQFPILPGWPDMKDGLATVYIRKKEIRASICFVLIKMNKSHIAKALIETLPETKRYYTSSIVQALIEQDNKDKEKHCTII